MTTLFLPQVSLHNSLVPQISQHPDSTFRLGGLSQTVFLLSESEANESAIKLVRQYFVEIGEPEGVHVMSSVGTARIVGTSVVSRSQAYR